MNFTRKKIIIITLVIVLVISTILIYILNKNRSSSPITQDTPSSTKKAFTPDFLSAEEKTKMGIETDLRIQAINRDQDGKIRIYKIIRNDSDIKNPEEIGPISPRQNR